MSDTSDQQPAAKKPGFFSRLLASKPAAPVEIPAEPAPAAGPEEKKRGVFARLFGAKEESQDEPPPPPPPPADERGWFARLTERIGKANQALFGRLLGAIGLGAKLDEATLETIEEVLIQSDVGFETTQKIIENLRKRARTEKVEGRDAIIALVKAEIRAILMREARGFAPARGAEPYVVLIVGVNGVGKTTTLGKMAKRCADAGLRVLVVAGDTFRAAAVEQLQVWAGRCRAEFMKAEHNSDAGALAWKALEFAAANQIDVVFIDTAGRLHTKSNLMAELEKVRRVVAKKQPGAPHETLIVIDATTGQNAIQQVREFSKAAPLNGIIMTKLDGTAKGGVLITIRDLFEIPVTLIGVGEGVDDLRDFDPEVYLDAMFAERND